MRHLKRLYLLLQMEKVGMRWLKLSHILGLDEGFPQALSLCPDVIPTHNDGIASKHKPENQNPEASNQQPDHYANNKILSSFDPQNLNYLNMDYSDIASVAGKGGLFKIVKPTRTGVILESLDDKKQKLVASATQRISVLSDISIYTTDQEGSRPLENVLRQINAEFGDDPGVSPTSEPDELKAFIKHIIPEYDPQRVYVSDIKKVVNWYIVLKEKAPDLLKEKPEEEKKKADKKKKEEKPD